MKQKLDKKIINSLKAIDGVEIAESAVESVMTVINAPLSAEEVYTQKEVDEKLHNTREEAKSSRILFNDLVKTFTGKERNEFDEKDRSKKMLDAVTNELGVLKTQNKEYQENMEPLKTKLEGFEKAAHEKITKSWSGDKGVKTKLDAILAEEENSKFKGKFVVPEKGKELTDEEITGNVNQFNEFQELGVPAFQSESAAPEENNNPKSKQKPAGSVKGTMTMDELMEKRHSAGLPS